MELLLALILLPGYLLFDILPKSLGYKGFSNWLSQKHKKSGDTIILIVYTILFISLSYLLFFKILK